MSSTVKNPKSQSITSQIKNLSSTFPERNIQEKQSLGCNSPAQGSQRRRCQWAISLSWLGPKEFLDSSEAQGRTSLVVQRLRICLPVQGTGLPSQVWEDHTAVEQLSLCAATTEARSLQGPCSTTREATAMRSPQATGEQPPLSETRERPRAAMKTQCSQN